MAKFRDSVPDATSVIEASAQMRSAPLGANEPADADLRDRSIGDILSELRELSAEQVEQILKHQRDRGVRFGEAALALGLVSKDDILFALSQQFHYPYAPGERFTTSPELVALNQPFSNQAEAVRGVRSQLLARVFSDPTQRAVAVVSADDGDGRTWFAANLAVSLAQLGRRTLLVDADLRSPGVHALFGLNLAPGLSGILSGRAETHVIQQIAAVPDLCVMASGTTPPNPLELIERPAFGLLFKELASKFDHVIVDTPAAVHGSDGAVIASKCGACVVVARKDSSRLAALQELLAALTDMRSKVAGVVFNEH
ncbi:MAG: polysaccharide biosynthesis tyrosine autokinase [Rubrivivax sp.]|jgi:protein-tyrosine kinase|nr:polysaccharide biosynthesis tyrosine autokinase [Rubrivivax sp.]